MQILHESFIWWLLIQSKLIILFLSFTFVQLSPLNVLALSLFTAQFSVITPFLAVTSCPLRPSEFAQQKVSKCSLFLISYYALSYVLGATSCIYWIVVGKEGYEWALVGTQTINCMYVIISLFPEAMHKLRKSHQFFYCRMIFGLNACQLCLLINLFL